MYRVFSGFQCKTFVSHILKGDDFIADFLLGQLLPGNVFIFCMVWAVGTAIDAVVGEIEGREHDNPVAVETVFNFFGQVEYFFNDIRQVTFQKDGGFTVADAFHFSGFFQNPFNEIPVVFIFPGIFQTVQNLFIINKFFSF